MDSDPLFDTSTQLGEAVNQLLAPFIGSFAAISGRIIDENGTSTPAFSSVVCNVGAEPEFIPAGDVVAVIDCYDTLSVDELTNAYHRIKQAKSLIKPNRESASGVETQMTTSIVVARNSDLTLEQLSDEIERLNNVEPSHFWPDAVAILTTGIINYCAEIPTRPESGDFFLPSIAILSETRPPTIWVQKVIRPTTTHTFNKIVSLVVARIRIYMPDIQCPDYRELIKEVPSSAALTQTYQFNLSNRLVPMSRDQVVASKLPHDKYNIVSNSKILASIQYQQWQDGSVFMLHGQFPIEPFLISLRHVVDEVVTKDFSYFSNNELQISFVLPINQAQFLQTLQVFEQLSSNLTVQKDTHKVLLQNVGNEGTSTPFIARLMVGVLSIRDAVSIKKEWRDRFDKLYQPVLDGLQSIRETNSIITDEWLKHRARVESGEIVLTSGVTVKISENIDRILKRDIESFLNTAVRTIKHSLQVLCKDMGVDFGFLFQKESVFNRNISNLETSDPNLAYYLTQVRMWSEPLVLKRNNLEHGSIQPPKVNYEYNELPVSANEPVLDSDPITGFTEITLDNICCFVEEMCIFCLNKKLPPNFGVTEIRTGDRDPGCPVRFHVTITPGGRDPWILKPHSNGFINS